MAAAAASNASASGNGAPAPLAVERLREFFAPQSIAIVGASDTSGWARFVALSSTAIGFTGPLLPVHPRHATALGRPAVPSLRDLAEPADLAFIMAPTHAVESVLQDAGAAGVRNAIVLASGFREAGPEGRALEDRLVACARDQGVTLLGPNCLGFLNAHARTAPFALTIPLPLTPGPVGIALQSGALASVVLGFLRARAIGVSTLATVGNEAMISTADVLQYLAEDPDTRVICLFLEEIGDPVAFARAARAAEQAGKPVVALKVGSSPAGQQSALAHTGAVAGDDAVVSAFLADLNVIRVTSLEELLVTGALLGYARWPAGRRMGVLTLSGGACDLIADRASAQGLDIPPFAAATVDAIAPHMPSFATVRNPLDATGYVLANSRTSALTPVDHALDAAVGDPGLDLVLFAGLSLPDARPPDERLAAALEARVAWVAQRIGSSPVPVIPIGATCTDVSPYAREVLGRNGLHLLGGIEFGLAALGHAVRWVERRQRPVPDGVRMVMPRAAPTTVAGPWSEARARDLLASAGVPVVPGELVACADDAVRAAHRAGLPVALKICSAQITHKSDIGGVALNLRTDDEIRAAYGQVLAAADQVPGAGVDGVLVTTMRSGGTELLAGVTVDPAFGPVLAVGLGGVWVEVLADTALRLLPVDRAGVKRMLGELRGAPLLHGVRGTPPADLDALAGVIAAIADAALSLGGALRTVEVNPLRVAGDQIEALDVLVVTGPAT
ncbi:MAG TPA: acetate--CoA ligase family protein [Streptosporangiaceae bacterium]